MIFAKVTEVFIYPIKGLTGKRLEASMLVPYYGIVGDRAMALIFTDLDVSPIEFLPWMSKKYFAVQNDWPMLAKLDCNYDLEDKVLTIVSDGVTLLTSRTDTIEGRSQISSFMTGYLVNQVPTENARHPKLARVELVGSGNLETRYPDRQPFDISIVSQGTLNNLSEVMGEFIDVRRFRPNILVDGIEPWGEFNWIGQQFWLGEARMEVVAKIGRCLNIEVNPDTGIRDIPVFSLLAKHFGAAQVGVLAKVITQGKVKIGDEIKLES